MCPCTRMSSGMYTVARVSAGEERQRPEELPEHDVPVTHRGGVEQGQGPELPLLGEQAHREEDGGDHRRAGREVEEPGQHLGGAARALQGEGVEEQPVDEQHRGGDDPPGHGAQVPAQLAAGDEEHRAHAAAPLPASLRNSDSSRSADTSSRKSRAPAASAAWASAGRSASGASTRSSERPPATGCTVTARTPGTARSAASHRLDRSARSPARCRCRRRGAPPARPRSPGRPARRRGPPGAGHRSGRSPEGCGWRPAPCGLHAGSG